MGQKLLSLRLSISCLRLEVIQLAPSAILFMAYLTAYDPASFLELKFLKYSQRLKQELINACCTNDCRAHGRRREHNKLLLIIKLER